jgi:hypothetical protein
MNLPEDDNQTNDPQQSNDDGLDQTTPNDNQELDRINDAVHAAEPSFTLNYESDIAGDVAGKNDEEDEDGSNGKQ